MPPYLLAIDIGTSACKIAVFDQDGTLQAAENVAYPVYYPNPGWAEQNPDEWWNAACRGIQICLDKTNINPAHIAGIGVDGQSWSCIPIDTAGNVLANTPIWMDTRAASICNETENRLGSDTIFSVSGNPFQPSYTTPKILWFAKNQPEIYKKTAYFLQCNSFIVYRLTGVISQETSQGYGLHVFDIAKKSYDTNLCHAMGIDAGKLPPIYESHQVVGAVSKAAALATGLTEGTPVVAGGLDAACGTLGAGVYKAGQTQEQGGQAGGMSICLNTPTASKQLILSPHVVPNTWLLQGGTVGGGGSLKWLAQELGHPELLEEKQSGKNQFALLDELAEKVSPGSNGVVFLPYLAGERSPLWDPNASGVFFGLHFSTTRAHFFRALLEGAAFSLKHNLEIAEKAGGQVNEMYAMGGAANSRLWTQIKADITGKKISVPDSDIATCKGTAILAGIGTGVYNSFESAVSQLVHFKREHTPNPQTFGIYQKNYEIYLQLYQQLKPTMDFAAQKGDE